MSQENVEILLGVMEADPRSPEGLDAFLAIFDPDVVWDMSRSSFPDARVYEGVDGVREWFVGLADAFGDPADRTHSVERVRVAGDRVVLMQRMQASGRTTQIPIDYTWASVWAFRDGKVVRFDRYDDWAQALKAVGLRE